MTRPCAACGADLHALDDAEPCPGCGQPPAGTVDPAAGEQSLEEPTLADHSAVLVASVVREEDVGPPEVTLVDQEVPLDLAAPEPVEPVEPVALEPDPVGSAVVELEPMRPEPVELEPDPATVASEPDPATVEPESEGGLVSLDALMAAQEEDGGADGSATEIFAPAVALDPLALEPLESEDLLDSVSLLQAADGHTEATAPAATEGASTPRVSLEFELQRSIGDAIEGPFDRITLQEMLYAERLTGTERVRVPGSSAFTVLSDHAEFQSILDAFHPETVRSGRAPARPADQAPAAAAPVARDVAVQEALGKVGLETGRLAVIVGVTVFLGVAVLVLLFISQM